MIAWIIFETPTTQLGYCGQLKMSTTEFDTENGLQLTSIITREYQDEGMEVDDAPESVNTICNICLIGKKTRALIPCGHLCCEECMDEIIGNKKSCPFCGTLVRCHMKIFV